MSTTKAGGKARQGTPRKGRRLGIKLFAGQKVSTGQILVRQIGSTIHPGNGADMGRDFTVYAKNNGLVSYKIRKNRNIVEVR